MKEKDISLSSFPQVGEVHLVVQEGMKNQATHYLSATCLLIQLKNHLPKHSKVAKRPGLLKKEILEIIEGRFSFLIVMIDPLVMTLAFSTL